MQTAEAIKKILDATGLSQIELAAKIGVERSQVTRYLAGERAPNQLACLFISALAASEQDRKDWISMSGLSGEQLQALAESLSLKSSETLAGDEQALLAWWREPRNQMERRIKDLVEQLLEIRSER